MAFNCPDCQEYREENTNLRTQLSSAQLWREKAEGLLAKLASRATQSTEPEYMKLYFCSECEQEWGYGHLENCLVGEAQSFLTPPTPTPGSEGGGGEKCLERLCGTCFRYEHDPACPFHPKMDEFLEQLAALEHEQWAHWTKYFLYNLTPENIVRWREQIDRPYWNFSESEKESDRQWARKVIAALAALKASE